MNGFFNRLLRIDYVTNYRLGPCIDIDGMGGIRIEDMVCETDDEIIELTTFERKISG